MAFPPGFDPEICFVSDKRKSSGGDGDTKKEDSPVKKAKLDDVQTEESNEKVAEAAA